MRNLLLALALAVALPCAAFAATPSTITGPDGKQAAVKAGSTKAQAGDTSIVVQENPNSPLLDAVNGPTPAGENHAMEVGGTTTIVAGTFTTPAGTTAYASGNLIANSATAGSVTPISFAGVCRINQGTGMVRRARIKTPDTGFAGKAVTLKLYRDSPTLTNGDHAAWLSTESNFIGEIPVTLDQTFSDANKGIGAPAVGTEINFDCAASSTTVYGLLVAGAAITPQGSKVFTIVLESLVN